MAWLITIIYVPAIFVFHGVPPYMAALPFIAFIVAVAAVVSYAATRVEIRRELQVQAKPTNTPAKQKSRLRTRRSKRETDRAKTIE